MRAPGAMFNTHIRSVKGLISKENNPMTIRKVRVDIRFTSDDHETLSLTTDNIQISVDYKQVEKLVEETRKDRVKA